jgi:signal transduction histidine kinase
MGMIVAPAQKNRTLIDEYCLQLGLLVERRHTERALIAARHQAEGAARLAEDAMRTAQAADRAKTKFLGNMTHELRTPLNAIIGFSGLIQSAPAQKQTAEYASCIHESGTRLLGILNRVIELARLDAGQLTLDEQIVAYNEIVRAALKLVRSSANEKPVAITADEAADHVIQVDPSRLTQVLAALLSNAVKFTAPGGHVEIAAAAGRDGGLTITVRDTGCGIPEEMLDKVVQPFGQVEEHLTREQEGIGLGLPIADALVRAHGGSLVLTSIVGVGTTAAIHLPASRVKVPSGVER